MSEPEASQPMGGRSAGGQSLEHVRRTWERLGRRDPLWAILTIPGQEENRWSTEEFFHSGEQEVDALVEHLRRLGLPRRPARALDFGCGVGRVTRALAVPFDEVVGVDVAESMVALARDLNSDEPGCRFVHNPTDDLAGFPPGSFDLVYSSYVLQHMAPSLARRYVAELVRLLGPGGVAVFQLPTRRAPGPVLLARALASPWRLRLAKVVASRWAQGARGRLAPRRQGEDLAASIEMHATPEAQVRRWVEEAGGQVVLVAPIFSAFSTYARIKWDHLCYFAVPSAGLALEQQQAVPGDDLPQDRDLEDPPL